jgi:sec-independent protein translocase protein TatB
MELFGVGPAELLVILVIALLVVGPHRLPEMAAQLGRFTRAMRRMSSQVTREFNEAMRDLETEYEDMKGEWQDVRQGLDDTASLAGSELTAAERDAEQALEEAQASEPRT